MGELMADTPTACAYRLADGPDMINVRVAGRDSEGRVVYSYTIHCNGALLTSGQDLRSGVGRDARARDGLVSLAAFLTNDAEIYWHYAGSVPDGHDGYGFGETVAEWAYGHSDELAMIELELGDDES